MIDGYSQHFKWSVAPAPGSCHRALCRHWVPGRRPLRYDARPHNPTALSLLTGLTFSLAPEKAIAVVLGAYVGSVTGGSRSAILINIPGTPAQAAVCLDGYPLALQGKAAEAIGLSVTASTLGTLIGFISLALFTPLLGALALRFGTWEFFWLAVFGVVVAGSLCAPNDPIKGWIAGFLGLLLNVVGDDGRPRDPAIHFQFRSALWGLLSHSGAHRGL